MLKVNKKNVSSCSSVFPDVFKWTVFSQIKEAAEWKWNDSWGLQLKHKELRGLKPAEPDTV